MHAIAAGLLARSGGRDAAQAEADRLAQLVLGARGAGGGLLGGFAHLVDKGFALILDRDAAIADRAVEETLAGEDDGNGDMAVERQLAPLVDRLALGGKEDRKSTRLNSSH